MPTKPANRKKEPSLDLILESLAGAALVLNSKLEIAAYTSRAAELLGAELRLGVFAPAAMCGNSDQKPIADALAQGRAVSAAVLRPDSHGNLRRVWVQARPLAAKNGWLLLLDAESWSISEEASEFAGMLSLDASIRELFSQIRRCARTQASVLVRGETGTGKELVARGIHEYSSRKAAPFLAVNCAAIPSNLIESELFGHVRGAFTGAIKDAPGLFRSAHQGTLFLDEVAELPLETQAKLLRVLQEKTVLPVGGTRAVAVDVRIVAATHRPLREAVNRGLFREDLLYRLRVIPLFLPPLRKRGADIEMLFRHFLRMESKAQKRACPTLSPEVLRVIEEHRWPGNVRELQNVVEYALTMGEGALLGLADLPAELRVPDDVDEADIKPSSDLRLKGKRDGQAQEAYSEEHRLLLQALKHHGGHHGRAASALGMSRVTLWRKLKQYEA